MNVLLALSVEEVTALIGYHAAQIGRVDEEESDRVSRRIARLRQALVPERAYEDCTDVG